MTKHEGRRTKDEGMTKSEAQSNCLWPVAALYERRINSSDPESFRGRYRLHAGGLGFACFGSARRFVLVVMRAAQEGHFIEEVFLEPLEPQIDHRRDKERHHLGENKTADNDEAERTPRRSVLTETERERDGAHQCGESRHHDRAKTFNAGFVYGRAQVPPFIDSLQRKIDNHDAVLLYDAEQQEQADDTVERQARSKHPERE